jgi:hypothetical protein
MTTWTQIDFGERVKFHAVPAELRTALLADMEARNHVPTATFFHPGWQIEEPLSEWHLDLGGGVFVGEPFVEITVDGLLVSCRAYQIEAVIRRCQNLTGTQIQLTQGQLGLPGNGQNQNRHQKDAEEPSYGAFGRKTRYLHLLLFLNFLVSKCNIIIAENQTFCKLYFKTKKHPQRVFCNFRFSPLSRGQAFNG